MSITVELLRHGPVDAAGRAYGQRHDPPLAADAATAIAALRPLVPTADRVVSSPSARCLRTAELLGLAVDDVDVRWAERDLGAWEGQAWQAIWATVPAEVTTDAGAYAAYRPPDGEQVGDLRARVVAGLEQLVGDLLEAPDTTQPYRVCVVTHAGPIACAVAHALGLDDVAALRLRPGPASRTTITAYGHGEWTVERLGA